MKFKVYGRVVGSKYLGEVEAENEEDAKEKGMLMDETYVSLCHQCSSECEDPDVEEVHVEPVL